jgi:hypothetical protein
MRVTLDKAMPIIFGKHAKWAEGVCDGLDYFGECYGLKFSTSELASMSDYTEEQINADSDLKDALTTAAYRIAERQDENNAYASHRDMCERVVATLEKELCRIMDSENIKLSIDWKAQELDIKIKNKTAVLGAILEIINAEGMFQFDSMGDFLESGPYTLDKAIKEHTHYLLNLPLIDSIYGNVGRHVYEYREKYERVSKADAEECLKEALEEYAETKFIRERIMAVAKTAWATVSDDAKKSLANYAPELAKL